MALVAFANALLTSALMAVMLPAGPRTVACAPWLGSEPLAMSLSQRADDHIAMDIRGAGSGRIGVLLGVEIGSHVG